MRSKTLQLKRVFTFLSSDPTNNPFVNYSEVMMPSQGSTFSRREVLNPTYTTLDFWKQSTGKYTSLLWEDSVKPSFILMNFDARDGKRVKAKIIKKIDCVECNYLVDYKNINNNTLGFVDSDGYLHFIFFKS